MMSFEEPFGGSAPDYPAGYAEIPTPESVQCPEQSTLQALLDVLEDKTKGGRTSEWGLQRDAELYVDGQSVLINATWLRPDITTERTKHNVGWVQCKLPVGLDGDYFVTTYQIMDILGELHIEKRVQMDTKQIYLLDVRQEEYRFDAPSGLEEVITPTDSRAIEDELGLSSVSEQEARDLLAFMGLARPIPSVDV